MSPTLIDLKTNNVYILIYLIYVYILHIFLFYYYIHYFIFINIADGTDIF